MPKHFTNFPEELEQYNPELLQASDFKLLKTFDSQKLLHSYNDQPASIRKPRHRPTITEFAWYQHNKVHREHNKPPVINTRDNYVYSTFNEKYEEHSYNDMPSHIDSEQRFTCLEWRENSQYHRDNDSPAVITVNEKEVVELIHYKRGLIHRGNGLPAHVNSRWSKWLINGALHNSKHAAVIPFDSVLNKVAFRWGLFGVEIPEDLFLSIISFHEEDNIPVWVAFLCLLGVVSKNDVTSLKDELNNWNDELPVEWLLRVWGVNEETFRKRINGYSHPYDDFSDKIGIGDRPLYLFKSILKYDVKNFTTLKTLERTNG